MVYRLIANNKATGKTAAFALHHLLSVLLIPASLRAPLLQGMNFQLSLQVTAIEEYFLKFL